MKNSNLITLLLMMLFLLILRSCDAIESVSRKSMGIGAVAFTVVIILVLIVEFVVKKK